MTENITSVAHINAITAAITHLVDEYEILDGRMAVPAQGRRATAMERVCAVTFSTVTDDLDPYGRDDLNEQLAQETLEWSIFVTDLMVTSMLDFREKAAEHHHRPGSYRDRLISTLLEIWIIALEELKKDPDEDQGDEGEGGELNIAA
ncbi:hypothetical protein [Arthrobacter sp. ES1]|uniref:hypothetical protein n=1 Tax=Arthrobacter sp. ES1 TaxID=1897056 RepID=UPI001CFFFDD5|nr:hypothetical protein [Arthrobacter sp. ES1]MCB5280322.1 hypothetical protein [Arthrobacter sp. ES1]